MIFCEVEGGYVIPLRLHVWLLDLGVGVHVQYRLVCFFVCLCVCVCFGLD